MTTLPHPLAAWRSRGRTLRIFDRDVFVLVEGSDTAEPIVVLHGFPTSSFDFHYVLPDFAKHHRLVVHDHLGFGLSDKPTDYSYSLFEQAEVAMHVWRSLGITRAHLVAHDYGTSVATEILARWQRRMCPVDFTTVTLTNGSVFIEMAHLTPSQRLLRNKLLGPYFAKLSSRFVFRAQLRKILGNPDSVSSEELDLAWASIAHANGKRVLPLISSYLDERSRFNNRWTHALRSLHVPVHVLWGRRDPVAVVAIAEALHVTIPNARLTWLDELGHYPMLENPKRWADGVLQFIDAHSA